MLLKAHMPENHATTALFALRIVQPLALVSIVLLSFALSPARALFARIAHPRQQEYDAVPDNDGSSIPQPTPVIVPVRSRRRQLTLTLLLGLSATYFASAVGIVLRAVISPRVWTPDLPLWRGLDIQSLGAVLGWAGVAAACLYEEKKRGRGTYGRGKAAWATAICAATDGALLIVYALTKKRADLPNTSGWTIFQIALPILRLVLLYPVLMVALGWDRVHFVRASEIASLGRTGTPALEAANAVRNDESSGLLHPSGASTSYGAVNSTASSGQGTPIGKPTGATKAGSSGERTPSRDPNASMGLSVAAAPPAPTFREFGRRLRILFPYLWPAKSPKLQALAMVAFTILILGRAVNFFVPLTLGKIVEDLSSKQAPWMDIALYAGLKTIQGSGGLLTVLQNFAWLPVEQVSCD